MKIVATVEARLASSRLPGKVLKPILGRPMLALLVERVRRARTVNEVVVATTTQPPDEAIVQCAVEAGARAFRGSEEDVLDRVLSAAEANGADVIIELTGDCPFVDPGIIDQAVEIYLTGEYDYVSNVVERTYPRGLDTQVFSTATLRLVSQSTRDPADREHVSLHIYEHPDRFRLGHFHAPPELSHPEWRWTVDTPEDFDMVRRVYEALYPENPSFRSADVVRYLLEHPDVASLNQRVLQKRAR